MVVDALAADFSLRDPVVFFLTFTVAWLAQIAAEPFRAWAAQHRVLTIGVALVLGLSAVGVSRFVPDPLDVVPPPETPARVLGRGGDSTLPSAQGAGQLLFITSGSLEASGVRCGDQRLQLCVFILEASKSIDVDLTHADAGHTAWSLWQNAAYQDILADEESRFWDPSVGNCGFGCTRAAIHRFVDGNLVSAWVLRAPAGGSTATSPPSGVGAELSPDELDEVLGAGNWRCIDGRPNAISIEDVPGGLQVRHPLLQVHKDSGRYRTGETVPSGGLATGYLVASVAGSTCSTEWLRLDADGVAAALGTTNWWCLDDATDGVKVGQIDDGYLVRLPIAAVDYFGNRFFPGDSVPSGPATAWLQGEVPVSECS